MRVSGFRTTFHPESSGPFIVIRAKSNTQYTRRYYYPGNRSHGLRCDQRIMLTGGESKKDYPPSLRRLKYHDSQIAKTFNFLTNNFVSPAQIVADLYRFRWQVELFCKYLKQHLRIKSFLGTSDNTVKSQIWIVISVYVLVTIIKKRLKLTTGLYAILPILNLTLFEKTPLDQWLMSDDYRNKNSSRTNQLNLFN